MTLISIPYKFDHYENLSKLEKASFRDFIRKIHKDGMVMLTFETKDGTIRTISASLDEKVDSDNLSIINNLTDQSVTISFESIREVTYEPKY